MRLSKIGKVVKEARQCILCNTRERTGQEANLIQQWIGSGEAMYPVDENVRLTEQGAAALMEMEGKDAEAVAWRSVGDGSELAEMLKGIPARIDGAALAWKVCLKVEIQSGTVRVKELEDGSMAYVWEQLLEPCKRKGKLLRMTRVDGKQGVYAVYAGDDLAGVVSGIGPEEREEMLRELLGILKDVKAALTAPEADLAALLEEQLRRQKTRIDTGRRSGSLSQEAERSHRRIIAALERQKALVGQTVDSQTGFAAVKADFDQMVQGLKAQAKTAGEMLNNLFAFCEEVFPEGQELLILVTELTINYYAATFISRYGCDAYFTHNQELLFYERQQEIISQLGLPAETITLDQQVDRITGASISSSAVNDAVNFAIAAYNAIS